MTHADVLIQAPSAFSWVPGVLTLGKGLEGKRRNYSSLFTGDRTNLTRLDRSRGTPSACWLSTRIAVHL